MRAKPPSRYINAGRARRLIFSKQPVFATRAQRRCDVRGCRDEESRRVKKRERPAGLNRRDGTWSCVPAERSRPSWVIQLFFLTPTSKLLFLLSRLEDLDRVKKKSQVSYCSLGDKSSNECGTNLERAEQALVYAHHGTCVVELATVVGGTEQSDELTLREELVAIFYDLMGTANEVHVVLLQETGDHVGTKCEGHTTVVFAPASDILVGIGPQKITQQTAIGNLKMVC